VIVSPARDSRLPLLALGYTALAIVVTWPLGLGLGRDVPGDLGDSLLNMWILAWGSEHIPRLLTGTTTWQGFWTANIFHPEPYSLALSEHLFAQAVQVAPVYWISGNIILGYNLLFLSTFVLSAIGMYLLVRDLTGDWRAAAVAGLVFGFLPYRIAQVPHLQILSSQWMPFTLWGLHRYVAHGSTRALVGGTAALVLQNLSCGYYLLYFAPFVPLFVVHQLWIAGRVRDTRAWLALAAAGVVAAAVTVPFLMPYLEVQRLYDFERSLAEVRTFSANVWSYATASESIRVWGRVLRVHPGPEGDTFLGVTAALLAAIAVGAAAMDARGGARSVPALSGLRRAVATVLALALSVQTTVWLSTLVLGGFRLNWAGLSIRASRPVRAFGQTAALLVAWLAVSPRGRAVARRLLVSPAVFYLGLALLAVWLSLGPVPAAGSQRLAGLGLYSLLYDHVPGFTGLRVPARFAMIAGLFLSMAAGYGAAALTRARRSHAALGVVALLAVADGAALPLPLNGTWGTSEATPPARVFPASQAPPIYQRLGDLPAQSVVAEFPFGDDAWELRYVYYSAAHRKRIVNGYSGAFPPAYIGRVASLRRFSSEGEAAWEALVDAGTTHVVVHASAFADPERPRALSTWLESSGVRLVERLPDGDALYALPGR
jgi:hypothetical protein